MKKLTLVFFLASMLTASAQAELAESALFVVTSTQEVNWTSPTGKTIQKLQINTAKDSYFLACSGFYAGRSGRLFNDNRALVNFFDNSECLELEAFVQEATETSSREFIVDGISDRTFATTVKLLKKY